MGTSEELIGKANKLFLAEAKFDYFLVFWSLFDEFNDLWRSLVEQIGRASCRERVLMPV